MLMIVLHEYTYITLRLVCLHPVIQWQVTTDSIASNYNVDVQGIAVRVTMAIILCTHTMLLCYSLSYK